MLNYSKASWAGTAVNRSGNGAILLDDVMCRGNEKSLEYCRSGGWGQHDCGHYEDAGVTCEHITKEEYSVIVRLFEPKHKNIGQVEVNYKGTWRPVCDDTWDILDAHVVCRMLGYKAALAAMRQYLQGNSSVWMGGVECSGEEISISQCYHRGWWNTSCPGNYYAGVMCQVTEDPPPVQVRLEEGSSQNSGRVAVRYGNIWGTICDEGFDINDAKVICRMLGYVGADMVYPKKNSLTIADVICLALGYVGSDKVFSTLTFRPGNGTIWLSNLGCNGTEKSIVDCRHPGWGQSTTCNHDNDVAIKCKIADAPQFQIIGSVAITDSTAVILFNDSQPIKSFYQVAVEKRDNEQRLKSYKQPLPFVFNEVDVTMATEMGIDSYITAEVLGPISKLTIGDGHYYHGYYNAPLEPGSMYRVHVRIVTMAMDGERIYGKSSFVALTTKPKGSPSFIYPPKNKTVAKGEQIRLICNATGHPTPNISWTKAGGTIKTGYVFGKILVIPFANQSDAGKYICTAKNAYGGQVYRTSVEVFVTVKLRPHSPVPSSTQITDLSIKVHWKKPESHGYPVLMYSVHRVDLDEAGQEVTSRAYHVNEDVHQYEVGDIVRGKSYKFFVTAWNTHGESVKDHSKSITVNVQKP